MHLACWVDFNSFLPEVKLLDQCRKACLEKCSPILLCLQVRPSANLKIIKDFALSTHIPNLQLMSYCWGCFRNTSYLSTVPVWPNLAKIKKSWANTIVRILLLNNICRKCYVEETCANNNKSGSLWSVKKYKNLRQCSRLDYQRDIFVDQSYSWDQIRMYDCIQMGSRDNK